MLCLQKVGKSSTLISSGLAGCCSLWSWLMNIFKNKYFLLGNLAFLLLAIPVALFVIKNQTSTVGNAAPTTTLSFVPGTMKTDQCTDKTARLVINPDQNLVSTVQLALKWDKSKFDVVFEPNEAAFPQTLEGPDQTTTGMAIKLNTGNDVTKAINTTTDVGVITIKPLAPTEVGANILLEIDTVNTKIYSLSQEDGALDVFNAGGSTPLSIEITAQVCNNQPDTPSTSPSPSPSTSPVVSPPTATPTTIPTATPTLAANASPICLSLNTSTSSGSAPLSVTLTAAGSDQNGTLTKATFNFGDGSSQEATSGLGTASGSAQIAHTYTSGGTFTATASFTDNGGAVSAICSKQIIVSGAVATTAPTATATLAPIVTEVPTATPTIAASGNLATTVTIIGGILLVIIGGVFLLAL